MTQLSVDLVQSKTKWTYSQLLKRVLWNVCWLLLFRTSPKKGGNPWRVWLLRLFGAKIYSCQIFPSCRILQPWNLEVNKFAAIGDDVVIYNYGQVTIGESTVISQDVYLCTGTHDYTHPHFPLVWKPIVIGDQCWLAAGVFVGPGVDIGNGSVVGAKSVVTKNMPPWTVCAGNPCKPIKPRVLVEVNEPKEP